MAGNDRFPLTRWDKGVRVTLRIRSPFRVGAGRGGLGAELPLLKRKGRGGKAEDFVPFIPVSSFKGLLRGSVMRASLLLGLGGEGERAITRLFGSTPPTLGTRQDTEEGILKFGAEEEEQPSLKIRERTSIRIDERYGAVARGALWDYEYAESNDLIRLHFSISFTYPIDPLEAALLVAGVRLLLYDSIGGFRSRGMGLIEEVSLAPKEFTSFAEECLKELLGRRNG